MNKSILKSLQICHENNMDYKSELEKFTLMYNVTPHRTTEKSPSELTFNRTIRDKNSFISGSSRHRHRRRSTG